MFKDIDPAMQHKQRQQVPDGNRKINNLQSVVSEFKLTVNKVFLRRDMIYNMPATKLDSTVDLNIPCTFM